MLPLEGNATRLEWLWCDWPITVSQSQRVSASKVKRECVYSEAVDAEGVLSNRRNRLPLLGCVGLSKRE